MRAQSVAFSRAPRNVPCCNQYFINTVQVFIAIHSTLISGHHSLALRYGRLSSYRRPPPPPPQLAARSHRITRSDNCKLQVSEAGVAVPRAAFSPCFHRHLNFSSATRALARSSYICTCRYVINSQLCLIFREHLPSTGVFLTIKVTCLLVRHRAHRHLPRPI